ncbi:MAG: carboxypeptidase-like regulatory domain-containing protein [Limisphaerales bacterium]
MVLLAPATNDIDLAVQLEPATDIAGTVLQPNGTMATGAKVFFRGEHFCFRVGENCFVSMPSPAYPFAVETSTGVDGAFRIPKIDGIDRLEVVHPEGWANVTVEGPSASVIRLKPWGRISGGIQSDQAVLPGVEVHASEARTGSEQMLFALTVKTDSEGRFEFSQVPGGRAIISVTSAQDSPGTNMVGEIQVESGQTATLTLSSNAQ